ncbi:MAG: Ger(x)C family spore germination C-terminal domain-containing protein, partial [Bacillota bacterium]|nr:Ger(x)C family spore germination C-terminal domain-containing protein [Bacillota bacterium]
HLFKILIAYSNQPGMQIMMPLIQPQPQEDAGGSSAGATPAAQPEGGEGGGKEHKADSIELKGTAVFRGDRMVGTLDLRESRGVAWLTGHISDTLVAINRTEGQVTQRADFAQVKYRLRQQNGTVTLEARVTQDGVLEAWPLRGEHGITPTILAQLEKDLAQEIEKEIRDALAKLQGAFNADIAGLGERIRRLDSSLYHSLNWDEAFPKLQLATEIEASFRRIGLTKK